MSNAARSVVPTLGALALIAVLGACGQDESGQAGAQPTGAQETGATSATHPEVSPIDPCDLATAADLRDATGADFTEGMELGPDCSFATADYSMTATVSSGLETVADHLDTEQTTVGELDAVQGAAPDGTQCLVDVTLGPDAPVDTLNTSITDAAPDDKPCDLAKKIAEKALTNNAHWSR
ncbi:hypothetical protein BJF85_00400 [Saccharomonospora sp. CUA-673]|uniref:DUF3558 family protein n=1 Tax=Saccharomonospora sp. CUA-673 TaxID=1904969 RepID=UPI0009642573|nr:DUF3558 family protein [Saccharomonospora sp. CUA-673]OLT46962.1 hypothetical protein BJF85_00400 [Saccharomonospora sp. CUA-673]